MGCRRQAITLHISLPLQARDPSKRTTVPTLQVVRTMPVVSTVPITQTRSSSATTTTSEVCITQALGMGSMYYEAKKAFVPH